MPQRTSPYRIEDGRYKCPHEGCEHEPFNSLSALKYHLSKAHEGFTNEDVAQAVETAREAEPETQTETTPAAPKRLSRKNRELNDKANEALNLIRIQLMRGLNEQQKARFEELSGELTAAVSGVEFDFEEKLVKVGGRFWLIVLMLLVWVAPNLPNLREIFSTLKEKKLAEQNRGSDRPDRERQNDVGGEPLQ